MRHIWLNRENYEKLFIDHFKPLQLLINYCVKWNDPPDFNVFLETVSWLLGYVLRSQVWEIPPLWTKKSWKSEEKPILFASPSLLDYIRE